MGGSLGVYDRMETETGQVYRQRGGKKYLYQYTDGDWLVDSTLGGENSAMYTTDLKNQGTDWKYWDGKKWQNDDPTIQFLPLTSSSCILQPSILLTSTGSTATTWPDYLGTFHIVQGQFSAGRPVWRNSKGRVLKIMNGKTTFGVTFDMTANSLEVRSASGPTCPTDAKAANSARFDQDAWQFWDGAKMIDDNKIKITSVK